MATLVSVPLNFMLSMPPNMTEPSDVEALPRSRLNALVLMTPADARESMMLL